MDKAFAFVSQVSTNGVLIQVAFTYGLVFADGSHSTTDAVGVNVTTTDDAESVREAGKAAIRSRVGNPSLHVVFLPSN